ncbi:MAG TPA: UbiH/UbiF/VisC/COQ6 family ubiquinone biosynthesis hydroxylase [Gammaproteobacteria bacterium]|jgi:2-octaprenylphenol hydroxylase|nr:UbiH/UbiF/VisC/COQ6 family ubiquinone biosynthesis hydroxylase [Gammaproteobacteria bacterium]
MDDIKTDVVIIGAGIAGLTLACALAQQTTLSIAIIEAQPASHTAVAVGDNHRVSAITLASQRIFKALSVWDAMKAKRISAFTRIHLSEKEKQGVLTFDSAEINAAQLGYIIENHVMQDALREKIQQSPQIRFLSGMSLQTMRLQDSEIQLQTETGQSFSARLAVAADGANSVLRHAAGVSVTKKSYDQMALVCTIKTTLPHEKTARQLFARDSILAFLPLSDPYLSSIVWSVSCEEATRLQCLAKADFQEALASTFSYQLGEVERESDVFAFPLYQQQAAHYVQPRVALVGDAAHVVHPLAGQGVNMGLLDVASLVDVVVEALRKKRDFSSIAVLKQYERWRKADNLALIKGIDLIKNAFQSQKPLVEFVRFTGLQALQKTPFLKNVLTYHAVGNRLGLPQLALE